MFPSFQWSMKATILIRVGLVLGMVGVVIMFIWGPPQPYLEEGVAYGLEGGTPLPSGLTVDENDERVRRLRRRHEILSRVGLALVGLGFAFQLAATFAEG